MKISFLITTFNKPDYLALVVKSIVRNVPDCAEIIIADDGSSWTTREEVNRLVVGCAISIRYCWLPNDGFRVARSRNLAALKATGDFLVFLDGDCVVTPGWWIRQKAFLERERIVFGSRLLLCQNQSDDLVRDVTGGLVDSFTKGRKFLNLPIGLFRFLPKRTWRRFRGFYFSIARCDYYDLGGFDEAYNGWGLEDSDFAVRALRLGMVLFDGRYAGSVLHLYHLAAVGVTQNQSKFNQCLTDRARTRPVRSILNNQD